MNALRLASKHANQQIVSRADFSGGLNTSSAIEMIADNELADCVNMDVDQATRLLKTVSGTETIYKPGYTIAHAIFDKINNVFLLVDTDRKVYRSDLKSSSQALGTLNGKLIPKYTEWEDGVLIAAGGSLQYYNGTDLTTIEKSAESTYTPPTDASGVYIRAGRVLVDHQNEIVYSGTGDETNWSQDDNNASTSKFLETGYKDGGKIVGMTSLSDSIIVLKSNNRVYKVSGEYPNWTISEISRNVDCRSRLSYCAVVDNTVVLGKSRLQIIQTTDQYGDMKVANIGQKVSSDIASLPDTTKVVFVPPLNQVWLITDNGFVLIYDLVFSSFYKRQFNSPVIDVISVNEDVYIIKADRVSKLSAYHFADDDESLKWWFKARRITAHNDLLLKRAQISITPNFECFCDGQIWTGGVITALPMPWYLMLVYKNKASIYHNKVSLKASRNLRGIYAAGNQVYENPELIYRNREKLWSIKDITTDKRCVFRNKKIDIRGYGANGAFILNSINMDIVEV